MSDGQDKEKLSSQPPVVDAVPATTTTPVVPTVPQQYDPAAVLASTSVAKTLTISDQHANILLTQADSDQKGLLKLTIVPFHKTDLACLSHRNDNEEEELSQEEKAANKALYEQQEKEHSNKVLTFLSKFDWRMTSNSGAEYSFHEGFPKSTSLDGVKETSEPALKKSKTEKESVVAGQNTVGSTTTTTASFKAELIFPASERQLSRAMPSPGFALVTETPALYEAVIKPFIQDIASSGSLSWLQNILQVRKEKERLLHNAEKWILNIDTKWRSHPDALTVPREQWYKHQSTADLYCLGILKQDGIASLRDLNGDHISVLREMLEQGPQVIEKVYGIKKDQLRIFVHYQPQFYHFHVHYTRLENDIGAQVEKAHLLLDIIQDLETDPKCFHKKTLVYKLSLKDKLYQLLSSHELES